MPRGKDALTLKQLCINVIARNFERLWVKHFDRQFGDTPRLLHVIGPFDDLPGQLCQDILRGLLERRLVRNAHLQLLLVPQVTELSFTSPMSPQALDIVACRCKNLTSLNLTNCMSLSPKSINQSLSSLPLLRKLILKQTKINDQTMMVIASYLPQLVHLDLHACPITDRGALWFCGEDGDFDPVCKDLRLLDISATKIELPGCCAILLCYPKLLYLSYPDTVEAVACIHKDEGQRLKSSKAPKSIVSNGAGTSTATDMSHSDPPDWHRLEILHATALRCRRVDPASVALACGHCPNVREVYWYQDATDEALAHLQCLQHLSVLEVTCDKANAVTFHGGVLPLLRARGQGMLAVGLYDVCDTDLGLLGSLCPQLQRLKIISIHEGADFCHSHLTPQQRSDSFRSLQQLTLVSGPTRSRLEPHDLELLLVNAGRLQTVSLIEDRCLTDGVLLSALSVHGFPCLKEMALESCHEVSVSSLMQLVSTTNPLTRLTLWNCPLVSPHDLQQLNTFVAEHCLNLNLQWER